MAKEFLSQNNIPYHERNISNDDEALDELRKRNVRSVPAFLVGDQLVVGFDKEKLMSLVH